MTFDFSFDLSVLDQAATTGKIANAEEQARLVLLKNFLQSDGGPELAPWQQLRQIFTDSFLSYVALCDTDGWLLCRDFINNTLLEIKQQLCYKDYTPKKRLHLDYSLSVGVWQELFQKIKIQEQANVTETDVGEHLATLCASVPCQVSHGEVFGIAAINCFGVRIELQVSDLVCMVGMINGAENAKVNLEKLITLDIRSPGWAWKTIILQCEDGPAETEMSFKNLEREISAQSLQQVNDPYTDLLGLCHVVKQFMQQKIQQERQLLSSLTHVLLNEDELNTQLQQSAQEMQKNLRQEVAALQDHAEQLDKFCDQLDVELKFFFPHYVKDGKLVQARKKDLERLFHADERNVGVVECMKNHDKKINIDVSGCFGDDFKSIPEINQNDQEAIHQCQKLAERGNPESQFELGRMYQEVRKNYNEAVHWYKKAAEQGHAGAQYCLGDMYKKGRGVKKDDMKAATWWKKSAEQGNSKGQHAIGLCYCKGEGVVKDFLEGYKWYKKSADQGSADAQYDIGVMYLFGYGMPKNYDEAYQWFIKAANQNHAMAQSNLGVMYISGQGASKDDNKALHWFTRSAKQGCADGQFNLGMMYAKGIGIGRNSKHASNWLSKAALQGHVEAKVALRNLK